MAEKGPHDMKSWVDRYGDYLYRYTLLRIRDHAVAEDVVQETFLAAASARKDFKGKSSDRTWLVGILKRKIVDYYRKVARERAFTDITRAGEEGADLFDEKGKWKSEPPAWEGNPAALLEQKEFWEVMLRCLAALPHGQYEAFTLRELENLSADEVCKVLSISPTNLWVTLHRARMRLRRCLEDNWFRGETRRHR
jgi:RNA polymerase sigma-70 factor (ECF subfamily)